MTNKERTEELAKVLTTLWIDTIHDGKLDVPWIRLPRMLIESPLQGSIDFINDL